MTEIRGRRLTIIGGGVMGLMTACTGYKFAPWMGRVLAQLAIQQGTVHDIHRFAPRRFAGRGATDLAEVGGTAS